MEKALLEALKKRKMNGPDLTIMIGQEPKKDLGKAMEDGLAPDGEMAVAKEEAPEASGDLMSQIREALLKELSDQDKDALMNKEPESLMDKVKKAQLMRKA